MHRTRSHAVGTTGAVIIQYPIFLDAELNRNELEIDKWDIEVNKLIEYKYKNNP